MNADANTYLCDSMSTLLRCFEGDFSKDSKKYTKSTCSTFRVANDKLYLSKKVYKILSSEERDALTIFNKFDFIINRYVQYLKLSDDIRLYRSQDEYYIMTFKVNSRDRFNIYICDQMDGVISLLKDLYPRMQTLTSRKPKSITYS